MASPIIADAITLIRAPKEDTNYTISGLSISDADNNNQMVTLTSPNGKITLNTLTGLTGLTGNGTGTVSFSGSLTNINNAITGMTFLGNLNFNGAATLQVSTNDGTSTTSQTVNLSISPVNDAPTMSDGTALVINEGGSGSFAAPSVVGTGITQSQLGLADGDNSATQVILKLTSLPTAGTLKLAGNEIAIGSTFSASQLNNLSYTHNGNQITVTTGINDSFNVTVDDGAGGIITNQVVNVKVMPVNQAPTVTGTISIIEGETNVRLDNNSILLAPFSTARGAVTVTDADDTVFTAYNITSLPSHGTLKYNGVTITAASVSTPFLVTDVSLLTYSHDGLDSGGSTDSFNLSVTDNKGYTNTALTTSATINLNILPNNDDPVLTTNITQTMAAGSSLTITNAMLKVTDVDSLSPSLTYTLTNVPAITDGYFTLSGKTLTVDATFTQDDINNSRLVYVSKSSTPRTDSISFTVKDGNRGIVFPTGDIREGGIYTTTPGSDLTINTFSINVTNTVSVDSGSVPPNTPINSTPTTGGSNTATLLESETIVFTSSQLFATDNDNGSTELVYRLLTLPSSGSVTLNGVALTFNQSFTQQDVLDGKVGFKHAGDEKFKDAFSYSVSDGNLQSLVQSFNLDITPQNDTPTAANGSRLFLAEGGTNLAITTSHIKLADADLSTVDNSTGYANKNNLSFTITSLPTHGTLTLAGGAVVAGTTVVTASQLSAGDLKYSHDGTESYTDSFKLVPFDDQTVATATATNQSSTGLELTVPITISPLNDPPRMSPTQK